MAFWHFLGTVEDSMRLDSTSVADYVATGKTRVREGALIGAALGLTGIFIAFHEPPWLAYVCFFFGGAVWGASLITLAHVRRFARLLETT
jgi:hypothetical protein